MLFSRPKVNQVFTPRSADVTDMYIARPELEKELKRALEGTLNPLIYGNSGTGKSWLYKKVLKDIKAQYEIANCANASRFDSLTGEIVERLLPSNSRELESIEEELHASCNTLIASGGGKSKRKYTYAKKDPLLCAFHQLRKSADNKTAVLVIDNLEAIVDNPKLMEELANIITLSDDSKYSQYNIKILIVGVPSLVLDYFSKVKNLPTIANRIYELPEVSTFRESQVSAFVENGFVSSLKVPIDKDVLDGWKSYIYQVTLGTPQRVHEFCEILGYQLEDNRWEATKELLKPATEKWIQQGLRESYVVVDSMMNDRETEIGRRNQVLYTLGTVYTHSFTSKSIGERLRKEFPKSTEGITLATNSILTSLAGKEPSIIKKTAKKNEFEFTDPRYLMVLRAMLVKNANEKVTKKKFSV